MPGSGGVAALNGFEERSIATARKGLAMALGDIVEMTAGFPSADVAAIDTALRAEGGITLTEVRARFWTRVRRILEKGTVRGETDYYALRNVVEALSEDEQAVGWSLLAAYEEKAGARK